MRVCFILLPFFGLNSLVVNDEVATQPPNTKLQLVIETKPFVSTCLLKFFLLPYGALRFFRLPSICDSHLLPCSVATETLSATMVPS
jgi:hypothetical protein